MSNTILEAQNICKTFTQGSDTIPVLKNVNLSVSTGESVAITGASGCGKTTLLQILAGLDLPTSGTVTLHGNSLLTGSDKTISSLRNKHLGFVWQMHHLLPELNTLDNVAMPQVIGGKPLKEARKWAHHCLELVGLAQHAKQNTLHLSGGERQRVAIARAIANNPSCILADEPTGNLDSENATKMIDILLKICTQNNLALIIITHNESIANRANTHYQLKNGTIHA